MYQRPGSRVNIRVDIVLVYGQHNAANKRRLWEDLMELRTNVKVLLIVVGDFYNKIIFQQHNVSWEAFMCNLIHGDVTYGSTVTQQVQHHWVIKVAEECA